MTFESEQGGGSVGWTIVLSEVRLQITQDLKDFYKSLRLETKDYVKQIITDWKKDLFPKEEESVDAGQLSKVRDQDLDNELFLGLNDKEEIKMESKAEGVQTLKAGSIFLTESNKEKLRMEMEEFWKDFKTDDCYQLEESEKEGNLKSRNSQYGYISDIWKERFEETKLLQKIHYSHLQILILKIKADGFASWKEFLLGLLLMLDLENKDWKKFKKKRVEKTI